MPAEQRGSAYRTGKGWGVRWFVNGKERQHASGFRTKSEALRHYRDTIAPRLRGSSTMPASIPLSAFIEHYLEAHAVGREASTMAVLRERLRYATRAFGDVPLADLERRVPEIAAWQARLPSGIRYGATQAFRQALDAGVRWGVLATNPAKRAGRNPAPKRAEIEPFTSDELLWLATELGPWGSVVQFAAATGLRPAEWIALERA